MILTGPEIARQLKRADIEIDPTTEEFQNPASWDLRLGEDFVVYKRKAPNGERIMNAHAPGAYPGFLDSREANEFGMTKIGPSLDIEPGWLYLFHTHERIKTDRYVPIIDGKSSIGRLGLIVHCTAGYGDPGFDGQYTLEVTSVAHVVRVYPGMRFCQVRFHTMVGDTQLYTGNYRGKASRGPVPSASWRQFQKPDS